MTGLGGSFFVSRKDGRCGVFEEEFLDEFRTGILGYLRWWVGSLENGGLVDVQNNEKNLAFLLAH